MLIKKKKGLRTEPCGTQNVTGTLMAFPGPGFDTQGLISSTSEYCCFLPCCSRSLIPYFFGYKTSFFSFQNDPKNLDPSYKTDLDLWDCLGRVKLILQQNFIGLI